MSYKNKLPLSKIVEKVQAKFPNFHLNLQYTKDYTFSKNMNGAARIGVKRRKTLYNFTHRYISYNIV